MTHLKKTLTFTQENTCVLKSDTGNLKNIAQFALVHTHAQMLLIIIITKHFFTYI